MQIAVQEWMYDDASGRHRSPSSRSRGRPEHHPHVRLRGPLGAKTGPPRPTRITTSTRDIRVIPCGAIRGRIKAMWASVGLWGRFPRRP